MGKTLKNLLSNSKKNNTNSNSSIKELSAEKTIEYSFTLSTKEERLRDRCQQYDFIISSAR